MSYDVKCHELAEVFLSDYEMPDRPSCISLLAQEIQNAIEDWLNEAGKDPSFKEAV